MSSRRLTLLLVAPLLLAGCGEGGPVLVPVSGTVTLNGKPLEGAELTFVPDPTNTQVTPGADVTGPEGNYKAMYQARSGLAVGKYKVIVSKKAATQPLPEVFKEDPSMASMAGMTKETLPAAYGDASKTSFSVEVPPEGKIADFDIKASSKSK